jgi:hypothetical protein
MPVAIEKRANELSTMAFVCAFFDEENQAVSPGQVAWSLTDLAGQVINGRDQVAIAPAAEVTIVLSGPDLQIREEEAGQVYASRRLVVEAQYSSTLGSDLPIKEVAAFEVVNLIKVA